MREIEITDEYREKLREHTQARDDLTIEVVGRAYRAECAHFRDRLKAETQPLSSDVSLFINSRVLPHLRPNQPSLKVEQTLTATEVVRSSSGNNRQDVSGQQKRLKHSIHFQCRGSQGLTHPLD